MASQKNLKPTKTNKNSTSTKKKSNSVKKKTKKGIVNKIILGILIIIILVVVAFIGIKLSGSYFAKEESDLPKDPMTMPLEETYLERDLISYQEVGYGSFVVDADSTGENISLWVDEEEKAFEKGYFAHAYSVIMFSFSNIYLEDLSTYYGINKTKRGNAQTSMIFKIFVDGEELFVSEEVNKDNPSGYVEFAINKVVSNIIFIIDDCGSNGNDHGAWADSKINYRGEL